MPTRTLCEMERCLVRVWTCSIYVGVYDRVLDDHHKKGFDASKFVDRLTKRRRA